NSCLNWVLLILPIPKKVVVHLPRPQKNKLNFSYLFLPIFHILLSLSSTLERPSARIGLSAVDFDPAF
ncbi:MAG: hypothetical protein ACYT04_87520, partial [Nostoc sp.]